jgi:hypothetical protein
MREENNKNALEVSFAVREHRLVVNDINELIDQLRVFAYINPAFILQLRYTAETVAFILIDRVKGHKIAHCLSLNVFGGGTSYLQYIISRFRITLAANGYKI